MRTALMIVLILLALYCLCFVNYFHFWREIILVAIIAIMLSYGDEKKIERRMMGGAAQDKLAITDPRFNLREVAKESILLERHLFLRNQHCVDCISKHYMTIVAYLEEAITLDKNNEYTEEANQLLDEIRPVFPPLIAKIKAKHAVEDDYLVAANMLRVIRKPLCVKYADTI